MRPFSAVAQEHITLGPGGRLRKKRTLVGLWIFESTPQRTLRLQIFKIGPSRDFEKKGYISIEKWS